MDRDIDGRAGEPRREGGSQTPLLHSKHEGGEQCSGAEEADGGGGGCLVGGGRARLGVGRGDGEQVVDFTLQTGESTGATTTAHATGLAAVLAFERSHDGHVIGGRGEDRLGHEVGTGRVLELLDGHADGAGHLHGLLGVLGERGLDQGLGSARAHTHERLETRLGDCGQRLVRAGHLGVGNTTVHEERSVHIPALHTGKDTVAVRRTLFRSHSGGHSDRLGSGRRGRHGWQGRLDRHGGATTVGQRNGHGRDDGDHGGDGDKHRGSRGVGGQGGVHGFGGVQGLDQSLGTEDGADDRCEHGGGSGGRNHVGGLDVGLGGRHRGNRGGQWRDRTTNGRRIVRLGGALEVVATVFTAQEELALVTLTSAGLRGLHGASTAAET